MNLNSEQGEFYLNNPNSDYCTFAYSGDHKFLERMENLFLNYGILESGGIHQIKDNFHYILTPLARLQSGLLKCFEGEIITSKESEFDKVFREIRDEEGDVINYEVEWNENKVQELAKQELEKFKSKWRTEFVKIYYQPCFESEAHSISSDFKKNP